MVQVPCGCFNTEMSRRAFGNTRHGPSRLLRKCLAHWRRWRSECGPSFPLSDANVLRDPGPHHRERRQQHPEPPGLSKHRGRESYRDNQKRNTHEDVFEGTIQGHFAFPSFSASSVETLKLGRRWLDHLASQGLWHQADICSAPATKTRAIEILCGALWTEHLFSAFHLKQTLASRLI